MGVWEDMYDQMTDWPDEMKARFEELHDKANNHMLNDDERSEYLNMRNRISMGG